MLKIKEYHLAHGTRHTNKYTTTKYIVDVLVNSGMYDVKFLIFENCTSLKLDKLIFSLKKVIALNFMLNDQTVDECTYCANISCRKKYVSFICMY